MSELPPPDERPPRPLDDKGPDPEPERAAPLDYFHADRVESSRWAAGFFSVLGFLSGAAAVVALGGFTFLNLYGFESRGQHVQLLPVIAFGVVGVTAALLAVNLIKARTRRLFVAGLLIGVAAACLLDGICFANP